MSELLGVIQQIVQEGVKGLKLADMATGIVLTAEPLTIQTDVSAAPIPAAALVKTSAILEKTVSVQGGSGGTVTVNEGVKAGDKVLLLRVSGGQRYIVLSKL